jgi:hypothetical protein
VITTVYGKLFNQEGELVAEGPCEINDDRRSVTLRPPFETPMLERQHGTLRLDLDDGTQLSVSSRVLHFRTNLPGYPPGNVYRLLLSSEQPLNQWPREQQPPAARQYEWEERQAPDEQRPQPPPDDYDPTGHEIPPEFRRE